MADDTTNDIPDQSDPALAGETADASAEAALADAAQQVADLNAITTEAASSDASEGTSTEKSGSFEFPAFGSEGTPQDARALDLLGNVNLNVKIELGRTRMLVEDVLRLAPGSVVELDKLAGDPVDIYVNDRFVAKGEVLVLNDNFCVRVNEIVQAAVESEAKASKAG